LSSIVGSIIGFIVATIVRPPYPFFKFTIIHIGIGNTIKLDFLLFHSLTWLPSINHWMQHDMRCCVSVFHHMLFYFYPVLNHIIANLFTGNIGNVPLVLIGALCRDQNNPFGDSLKCSTDGTAYISFGQWVSSRYLVDPYILFELIISCSVVNRRTWKISVCYSLILQCYSAMIAFVWQHFVLVHRILQIYNRLLKLR
jgi:hypothetical protein